jgi:hypothetical protein
MHGSTIQTFALGFLALAPALIAQPRSPQGIYAVVNIDEYTQAYDKIKSPSMSLEEYLVQQYQDILSNPAVSGLAIWVKWSLLNPKHPGKAGAYQWYWLDDVFNQVEAWNNENPGKPPKTVQLVPTPGFNSPTWLLAEIYSCNFLFSPAYPTPPIGSVCGKATFSGFKEGGVVSGMPIAMDLPLPWDPTYKSAWQSFLMALNNRYGSNPWLVSISVAGPTASSEEMILPAKQNTDASATQIGGLTVVQMWDKLLKYQYAGKPDYLRTDQAFIDEWENAINMYAGIFNSLTLVLTTGDGLPNLTTCDITSDTTCTFSLPLDPVTDFSQVCPVQNMDCAAETTILSYFDQGTVGGTNGKSTQTDGMKGSGSTAYNLGVPSVKLISESTSIYSGIPSGEILGGSQFAKSFSNFPVEEGCTSIFPPSGYSDVNSVPVDLIPAACLNPNDTQTLTQLGFTNFDQETEAAYLISPEQAEYNVLSWFFSGTVAGPAFGASVGTAPLNYLQIYGPDITYATKNATSKAPVVVGGSPVLYSAQDLLNMANAALVQTTEAP